MNRILTKALMTKERVENKTGILSGVYDGKAGKVNTIFDALPVAVTKKDGTKLESMIVAAGENWVNSKGYVALWNRIEDKLKAIKNQIDRKVNIAQFPDDYYDLIDMIRIDITRRRIEEQDFTTRISTEIVNPAFSRSVRLDEFLPFVGAFLPNDGSGESVPLIQQKTGQTGTADMNIYAIGHERSLEDELYNLNIYSLQKVLAAVVRAHTGARNALCMGPMIQYSIDGTWAAAQSVPASVNDSYELALYQTLHNALRHLYDLADPQTLLEINAARIALVVGKNTILFDLNRIMNGNLALSRFGIGSNDSIHNVEPLPIDEIWKYKGDTLYIGPEKITYPGVPDGKAYLLVVSDGNGGNGNYTLTKRGLTQEVGRGDVLTLAREKRAWYFVQGRYNKEFFGETGGCASGTGYIVEIDLPTFNENT